MINDIKKQSENSYLSLNQKPKSHEKKIHPPDVYFLNCRRECRSSESPEER